VRILAKLKKERVLIDQKVSCKTKKPGAWRSLHSSNLKHYDGNKISKNIGVALLKTDSKVKIRYHLDKMR
jgi:hypothetical protein